MNKLLGKNVNIILRSARIVSGLIVEVDEDLIYLQGVSSDIAIPRSNVEYYEIANKVYEQPTRLNQVKEQKNEDKIIRVSVDGDFVTKIHAGDHEIEQCSTDLFTEIIKNNLVQIALQGKKLVNAEYSIGDLNILTKAIVASQQQFNNTNSFSLSLDSSEPYQSQTSVLTSMHKKK